MTNAELIRKYNIHLAKKDGEDALELRKCNPKKKSTMPCKADMEYLQANREALIAEVKAADAIRKQEEAARDAEWKAYEAAAVRFTTFGWESHQVSVDTRKNLDDEFARIASQYPNDCTIESVKKDYEDHLAKTAEKEAAKKEKEAANKAHKATCLAMAKETGQPQVLKSWMADCNDPREECSTDIVTHLIMPDGTEQITRQHTW